MKNHHTLTTLSIKNRPQQNTIYLSSSQLKISRGNTFLQGKKDRCHWQRDRKVTLTPSIVFFFFAVLGVYLLKIKKRGCFGGKKAKRVHFKFRNNE